MNPTALAAALAALAPLTGPQPQAPPDDEFYHRIERHLEDRFDATGVPGAAYAIIDLEGDAYAAAWGETGDGDPVGLDTPFLWGSVAKPVTATAAMTLVEDGLLDLDEPVTAYLPEFALADRDHSDRITVRHLLEQTSGIPEGTGVTDRSDHGDDPYGDAVADLADVEPLAEPGEAFVYASANYLVAGAVIQAAAGVPYEEYLRAAVLDPLGMDGAVATADAAAGVPRGHAVVFGDSQPVETPFDPTGPSYGYLGGTVTDLQRFAEAMLDGGRRAGVLTEESVALMHTGAAEVSETIEYGLGWRVDERTADLGTTTVWHTGAAPGFSAGAILLPELGRALVVVQNRYGFFQDGELIGTMLGAARMLAGGEPGEWEPDPLYPWLLAGLCLLTGAAAVLAVWTFLRPAKAPKASGAPGAPKNSGAPEASRAAPAEAPDPAEASAPEAPAATEAATVEEAGTPPAGTPKAQAAKAVVGAACWTVLALAVAYASFFVVPGLAPSRAAFTAMAPDVAWLLVALGTAALVLAAARIWSAAVRLRRAQGASPQTR